MDTHIAVTSDSRNPVCFYCGDSQFYGDRHRAIATYDGKRLGEAPCPLTVARSCLPKAYEGKHK